MTYTRRNFQRRSAERILDRHESLINYANHLRTTAALPPPRREDAQSQVPFPFVRATSSTQSSARARLAAPNFTSFQSRPRFFPLASETTRLARGLFIKTFELTLALDAFVLYLLDVHILVLYIVSLPFLPPKSRH